MRPDTDLSVVVTDANGVTTILDSHASDPGYIPQGITHGTQQGSGFYTGGFTVSWPIDREHPALHLRDKVQFVGAGGDVAYEGFITDLPRSMSADGRGTLSVQLAGYMADTARQSFVMPFVDRELSAWRPVSRGRLINLMTQTYRNTDAQVLPDVTSGAATLLTEIGEANWATGVLPCSEAWYDAGAARLGSIYYDWQRSGDVTSPTGFQWVVSANSADDGSVLFTTDTGDLDAVSSTPAYLAVPSLRFARVFFGHTGSPNTASEGKKFGIYWKNLALYGDHGLPLIGSTDPQGVAASDVLRWLVERYCPKLNTAGVQDTTYPIEHLAFRERTKVYDALLNINSFHMWQLAVWEDGTVHYGPVDLTEWDWEVRHDEPGAEIALQGDSVENLRNGLIVSFTNVATQAVEELHPDDHAELRDDDPENPYNLHGDRAYGEPYTIPFPTTAANALELGRVRLLEDNQIKAPGSITANWTIKDRAGNPQPVWKVRCGDRVRITSSVNLSDRPRLIQETSYSHDGCTLTMSVDSTLRNLDGFMDRMATALTAAGYST